MRRTSITASAGILAALTALTACGTVQMGSAAIAGDQGISASTLTSQVSNLKDAYNTRKGSIQLQYPLSQAPQQVLSWLLRFRIRDRMAARNGITVTQADSETASRALEQQARQNHVKLADLAVANGLPPDLLPQLGRYEAIQTALVRKLDGGTLPTSQSGLSTLNQEFGALQCHAAKSLAIRVNPQFGRLDYNQLAVVPAELKLSAPPGGVPTPTPRPQLTPPC
jgi:hypothetical protein